MAGRFYFADNSLPTSRAPTTYSADDERLSLPPLNTNTFNSGAASPSPSRSLDLDDDDDDDDNLTSLPFPKPLSRPTFNAPSFEPHAFLASLSVSNRFQTLEDLQTELRDLSLKINTELIDLVNSNYEAFFGLGAELKGGEEKVEEIRVGLLGFEKDVTGLRARVVGRREEVEALVEKKRELRKEAGVGKGLLEVDERLRQLERVVRLEKREERDVEADTDGEEKWSDEWDEGSVSESGDEYDDTDGVPGRLRVLAEQWLIVKLLVRKYDPKHPFLVSQRERMHRVHGRVVLEIEAAVRSADDVAVKQKLIQLKASVDE